MNKLDLDMLMVVSILAQPIFTTAQAVCFKSDQKGSKIITLLL